MLHDHAIPYPPSDAINASFTGETCRTFVVSQDKTNLSFKVTRKALREFEREGLEAMDDSLISLSERLTPANAPEHKFDPLTLLSNMLFEGLNAGDTQTMMICVLWLSHHYPSILGITKSGHGFEFSSAKSTAEC